jgi:hypothetical protein
MTACEPTNLCQMYSNPVGAGLPAMPACQPTNLCQMYSNPVGAGLPAMPACQPTNLYPMSPIQLWEPALLAMPT